MLNAFVYKQMSPRFNGGDFGTQTRIINIESLRHAELFKAARATAASFEEVLCHVYGDMHSVSLHHAAVRAPYILTIAEGYSHTGDDFRIQISNRFAGGFNGDTINICHIAAGEKPESDTSTWWPTGTGWWLRIDEKELDFFEREADDIKTQQMVSSFREHVFPGQTFGCGEHDLNPLLLDGSNPDDPASARHPNAIKMIERIVRWFIDLHKIGTKAAHGTATAAHSSQGC